MGRMNSRRIALWAAVAAATLWAAKSAAIGAAGGLDKSPLEGPLFLAGLASFVVAVIALGFALTPRARTWVRMAAGTGAFLLGFAATTAVNAGVEAVRPLSADRTWVWAEVNLWVAAVVVLAITVSLNRSRRPRERAVGQLVEVDVRSGDRA